MRGAIRTRHVRLATSDSADDDELDFHDEDDDRHDDEDKRQERVAMESQLLMGLMGYGDELPPSKDGCLSLEGLVEALIRPERADYSNRELGPLSQSGLRREDFTIINGRGKRLVGSLWKTGTDRPIVIYLHGNSSCRVEAVRSLNVCAVADLVAFDFAGSGHSDGRYVTLGYFERYDVADVINSIVGHSKRKIILWGRSMGAVTALLYAALPGARVDGLVLDSPFFSVQKIVEDLLKTKLPTAAQSVAASALLTALRKATTLRTGGAFVVDIDVSKPMRGLDSREWLALASVRRTEEYTDEEKDDEFGTATRKVQVKKIKKLDKKIPPATLTELPMVFFGGRRDDFIPPHVHMDAITKRLNRKPWTYRFSGGHNDPRPPWVSDIVATFVRAVDGCVDFRSAKETADILVDATTNPRQEVALVKLEDVVLDELLIFAAALEEARSHLPCGGDLLAHANHIACLNALTLKFPHWASGNVVADPMTWGIRSLPTGD